MKSAQRLVGPFRELGIAAGLLYAFDRVLMTISPRTRVHVYELMEQPVSSLPAETPRGASSIEVREIGHHDPALQRMPVRPDVMRARLAQETLCLGAFLRGELIGYMWFSRGRYDEDEVRCTYVLSSPDRAVFDFDMYLFPEHRMGRGFIALWSAAKAFLGRLGVERSYSRMSLSNSASRRAHLRLGSRHVAWAVFLQLFGLELVFASVRPFVKATMRSRARLYVPG